MSRKSERPKGPRRRSPWSLVVLVRALAAESRRGARTRAKTPPSSLLSLAPFIRGHHGPSLSPAPSYGSYWAASSSPHAHARLAPPDPDPPERARVVGVQLPRHWSGLAGLAPEDAGCPGRRGLALPPPPPAHLLAGCGPHDPRRRTVRHQTHTLTLPSTSPLALPHTTRQPRSGAPSSRARKSTPPPPASAFRLRGTATCS